jgi:hypothetical protein
MKIFSEMIVLHEDVVMPEEGRFVPSFWLSNDFDSDGDYYYEGIDGRWTTLRITKRAPDGKSMLEVDTFREKRLYNPGLQEAADLERYITYWRAGRYREGASHIQNPAVTSLRIEAHLLADYREFLETVAFFLAHSKGIVANFKELDAAQFRAEFLDQPSAPEKVS